MIATVSSLPEPKVVCCCSLAKNFSLGAYIKGIRKLDTALPVESYLLTPIVLNIVPKAITVFLKCLL